jgi:hypothetical protein
VGRIFSGGRIPVWRNTRVQSKNPRDARLLAATGALSLAATGIAFYL